MRADAQLDAGGHVGHLVVVAAAAEHDELDALARDAGAGERARRGDVGKLAERHVRDAPFADAGAAHDPLIRSLEDGGDILVGQHRRGQALSPAGDRGVGRWRLSAHGR